MGAMQNPAWRRAPNADLDVWGEKTSEHGHYEMASQYKSGKTHHRWVEDNRTFEAPPATTPDEPAPEPLPEKVEEPTPTMQQPQAQSLVDKYTSDISSGIYNTQINSPTANLNQDLPNNVSTTDNNTFASGTFNPVDKSEEAAQNFLTDKKNLVLKSFR